MIRVSPTASEQVFTGIQKAFEMNLMGFIALAFAAGFGGLILILLWKNVKPLLKKNGNGYNQEIQKLHDRISKTNAMVLEMRDDISYIKGKIDHLNLGKSSQVNS